MLLKQSEKHTRISRYTYELRIWGMFVSNRQTPLTICLCNLCTKIIVHTWVWISVFFKTVKREEHNIHICMHACQYNGWQNNSYRTKTTTATTTSLSLYIATFNFCLNQTTFSESIQLTPDRTKVNFCWELLKQDFLQVGCPSCCPTKSIKAHIIQVK